MNQLRVLSLTTLMLMLASRLPGQVPNRPPVVCNDGTITFSVARAYRHLNFFSGYEWQFEGWYNVDPGKCKDIGPSNDYDNGGMFRKDSVTLLAFAFYDSTGTWGAIKLGPFYAHEYRSSNQQFCVQRERVAYDRDSPGGDLPRACDGAQTGYQMIPASYEYEDYFPDPFSSKQDLHVKLGPSDRAIPLGPQTVSGGAAPRSSGAGTSQSNTSGAKPSGDSGDSLGTQVLKALAKDADEERQKQARRQTQVAPAAPQGGFARFVDGCNAFYRDPANARLSMSDATGWCGCLSNQYRNLMTPEEESKYANDFERLFHGGIAQPLGFGLSKSDPAWPRLHPAVERCAR